MRKCGITAQVIGFTRYQISDNQSITGLLHLKFQVDTLSIDSCIMHEICGYRESHTVTRDITQVHKDTLNTVL